MDEAEGTRSALGSSPTREARQAFLDARREATRDRYDRLFASTYDEHWGEVSPSHATMLGRLIARTAPGAEILDAACGTGKYWPAILSHGRRVLGIDQSAGMLAAAARKFPEVPSRVAALQDLDEHDRYDAVMCVDALEMVGPEEWPIVARRLRDAAKPGAPIWLTVELRDPAEAKAGAAGPAASARTSGPRDEVVVEGEDVSSDGGYHYFPARERVLAWLAESAIAVEETLEADSYLHVLGHRRHDEGTAGA
jgi:SAM-dependent methyltransferase